MMEKRSNPSPRASRKLRVGAPAKVNLYLEVIRKRPDGFHDLESIFQTIELHDVLDVTVDAGGYGVELSCDNAAVPADDRNLAWRAAALFQRARPDIGAVKIELTKRIPHAAGLGGGSSDAAAVLRALQRLSARPLPGDQLAAIALELGSDVPFFLVGGTAHGLGRGELLTPLPDLPPLPITVLKPPADCATPAVFRALSDAERGPRAQRGASWWQDRPEPQDWIYNRLTEAAVRVAPVVGEVLAWLEEQRVPHVMTGSGSACIALGDVTTPARGDWRFWRTSVRPRDRLDES